MAPTPFTTVEQGERHERPHEPLRISDALSTQGQRSRHVKLLVATLSPPTTTDEDPTPSTERSRASERLPIPFHSD